MSYSEGYDAIAKVYDKLNSEIDYKAWADYIEQCFVKFMKKKPEIVLDLACGTGRMTHELALRGYDMIGVDGSEDMLNEAYQREISSDNLNILYLLQDMRNFELYGTVGAVICCLDSMNYLIGENDFKKCLKTVHNYLEPEGLFVFDMNSPYKFENIYGDNSYILEDCQAGKAVFCGWQNYYDIENKICNFYLTLFEERENCYIRSDEEQREMCYSMKEITDFLSECGFSLISVCKDYNFSEIDKTTERWYFAAKRI